MAAPTEPITVLAWKGGAYTPHNYYTYHTVRKSHAVLGSRAGLLAENQVVILSTSLLHVVMPPESKHR